jgi:hypothetical protein
MDTHTVVTYEVIEPVSNKRFFTKSHNEAYDYYEKGWMVYETHATITQPTLLTQTRVYVTVRWNFNPKISEGGAQ